MASTPDPLKERLCLVCRQAGHVVEKCPRYIQHSENPDSIYEPVWPVLPLSNPPDATQALCERCSRLDVLAGIATLVPFVQDDKKESHSKRATKKTTQLPSLGPVLSLQLLSTCPLCCFLFDMSYIDGQDIDIIHSGGELVLVVGWTIHRLEGALDWHRYEKGKGPYAKCVYTSMKVEFEDGTCVPAELVDEAMDAFGLVNIGEPSDDEPALRVRRVDPRTPDYSIIKAWLRRCDDLHHITCQPLVSDDLKQIKLVHVETRQVVAYPVGGCDYVALSYVWGDVEQYSYQVGDIVPTVPATLEDAMVVVRNLGKQYLWADSLCIDQGNDEEKAVQIALMSTIYCGAWATIVCLSSGSDGSGIPRVGTLESVIPQLSCEIWGKQLLSMMPTLSQQILWSPWGSRAWAYQEGLLSSRCLFFTNHQVYFECNSVQCCESLIDSNSPFHLQSDEERVAAVDDMVFDSDVEPEFVVGCGVLRDPFRPISIAMEFRSDVHFRKYLDLVHSYTIGKMTRDADSLNAFSAVLARLEENWYCEGFVQGLPVEDLPRALLWFHPTPPRRRIDFPAWSWAGWEGEVSDDEIHGARNLSKVVMPPLCIWKAAQHEPIYEFNPTSLIISESENSVENDDDGGDDDSEDDDSSGSDSEPGYESDDIDEELSDRGPVEEIKLESDPVFRISKEEISWVPAKIEWDELRVEGIVIRLSFVETPEDQSDSGSEADNEYDIARCSVHLQGHPEPQQLKFYGHDAKRLVNDRSNKQQEFLLVSRENAAPKIYNALLLIDQDGVVARRVGVASLRLDSVELLDRLEPERRLFKLS